MTLTKLLTDKAAIIVANQNWNAESLSLLVFQYANTLNDHTPERLEEFLQRAAEEENSDTTDIALTGRERDTILAALRHYQRHARQMSQEILDIAENGRDGFDACLTVEEIDALCEELNQ